MKASEAKFLDFLKKSPQFVIPIYQRTYSWTSDECQQLWDDVLRAGQDDRVTSHFVGSIVYVEKGLSNLMSVEPLLVIDGQQRLTTLTLLLTALHHSLEGFPQGEREPLDGFAPRKLRNWYLINDEEEGDRHFKLLLSQTDKQSLIALVDQRDPPKEQSLRIAENFGLFQSLIRACGDNLLPLCKGLAKLVVVDIALDRTRDNPQLIFESMNSTGRKLSQADLIRNFILMGLEPSQQTLLYNEYWRSMELAFGQEAYGQYFDGFMRHYLTVKTGEIPRLDEIYEVFRLYSRKPAIANLGVEALVRDIRDFARYFCAMALGSETDPQLKVAFHDLRELKVDVAYPFLLELYHDYANDLLPREDFLKVVRLIEGYVFRRAICAVPTNSMNKTFSTFAKALKKDRYLESVQAHFLTLPSYRRFPTDDEFRRDFQTRDLYYFRSRSYWLRRFENFGRKERVVVDEYTIEHILPQNENLSSTWREELGEDWARVQETWLHTLGNLTLTGYNSEYSDKTFSEKRDMAGGFRDSPLKLNADLRTLPQWNERQIKARAERLANNALEVWPAPLLEDEILSLYQQKSQGTGYRIEDHPQLHGGKTLELFEAFRTAVLALDPCVNEEFLKLYVAYKAETNFVDVVPQVGRLRVALNMEFAQIHDPNGLCQDVTGLGRWGNGDVSVLLDSLDGLPYVIGLVRQALELQMGNGADA